MGSNFGDLPEHRQGEGDMDLVGKYSATGRGGKPGVILLLPGGDTCGPAVWIGLLGAIRRYEICSSPRRPLFLHALSSECTSKLRINFLNHF